MEVKVAKTAGFCYGVERAVEAVYREIENQTENIYTYGPIVHNEVVVNDLKEKGVRLIADEAELRQMIAKDELKGATVIVRAHGIGMKEQALLNDAKNGIRVVDATCPHVKKIHNIVKEHYDKGETIVVTGSKSHPEVQGILGQIGGHAVVIETPAEADAVHFSEGERICLVSQTTFNMQKFEDIVDIFRKKRYYMNVINTICNATQRRQTEAAALAAECDAMLVIGGRNSSNTAKLYDICRSECEETYFIQSLADFKETINSSVRCVGITAGASTPKSIIEEVLKYVRDEF